MNWQKFACPQTTIALGLLSPLSLKKIWPCENVHCLDFRPFWYCFISKSNLYDFTCICNNNPTSMKIVHKRYNASISRYSKLNFSTCRGRRKFSQGEKILEFFFRKSWRKNLFGNYKSDLSAFVKYGMPGMTRQGGRL